MDFSNPLHTPLYNSTIINCYMQLIQRKYSEVDTEELLRYAGMENYEIADEAHWFTQTQVDRFYEKLVQMTRNPGIAREAGRYAASANALGALRKYILGLISPIHVFEIIQKTAKNLSRSCAYEARKISSSKIEIVVTPYMEGLEKQFQCENRIGFFETIVLMFGHKNHAVAHPKCIFRGDKVCRYIVSWEKTCSDMVRLARDIIFLLLLVCNLILMLASQWDMLKNTWPFSIMILLTVMFAAEKTKKDELINAFDNTRDSNEKLIEQININYNNAHLTNEVGQALSSHINADDILANVVAIMERRLDFSRGFILLANKEGNLLEMHASFGYSPDQCAYLGGMPFNLEHPSSNGILILSFRDQRPFLITDLKQIAATSPRTLEIAAHLDISAFICCPIVCEGKSLGILLVDSLKADRPLVERDVSLVMGIASVLGISLRNSELVDRQVEMFKSMLHVLAASIDARDSLTAGHSEKVTEYSVAICNELDLPSDYCEMIRVAALLHDYGKIWVPDAILKKNGRLTPEEYEIIKMHSQKTFEILSQIKFEGIFCQVPGIAGAHHEKLDGSGYPQGLSGDRIPLGAKIIAVADYFEAITAKRHYRDPMPVDEAFALLRQESGKHLEGTFVEVLIAYYTRTRLGESSERTDCP